MKINKEGIQIIKDCEGLMLSVYLCPANVPTIGYGTTYLPNGDRVTMEHPDISEAQAEHYLKDELGSTERGVEKALNVGVTDNQFSALVSLAYNIGGGAFNRSTLLRLLNGGDTEGAADQFRVWRKYGGKVLLGLVKRRKIEAELFNKPGGTRLELLKEAELICAVVLLDMVLKGDFIPGIHDEVLRVKVKDLVSGTK